MRSKHLLWPGACLLLMALLSACGGGSGGKRPISNEFTVSLSPTRLTINQGESGTTTLIITPRNGFTGTVSLSVVNPHDGITVSFDPSSLNVPCQTQSTVTVEVGSNVSPHSYSITLVATSGNIQKTAELTVNVLSKTQPDFTVSLDPDRLDVIQGNSGTTTLTITPVNGFRGTVSLSAENVPTGITVSFNPNSLNVPDKTESTVTVEVGSNVSPHSYSITLVATSGNIQKTAELTVNVLSKTQPDFTVSLDPDRLDVIQGNSGTTTLTITPVNGFTGTVSLSVVDPPDGITVRFNPSSLNVPDKTKSTVTVEVGTSVRPGTYTLTFKASSGSIQRTATLNLTVQAPPDFTVSLDPDRLEVIQGQSGTTTLIITPHNGFTGTVSLSVVDPPDGITVRFNPSSLNVPEKTKSTVTVEVGTSVRPGTYTLTSKASSGSIQRTATLNLTVQAPPDFTVSLDPDRLEVIQGQSGTTTLIITPHNGFTGTVSLSVVDPPDGITVRFNPSSLNVPDKTKSTVTVEVGTSVRPGTYTLTFKASSGSIQRTATLNLTVLSKDPPDFNIIIYDHPTIIQGGSGQSVVYLLTKNGFTGTIHLSAENVPSGITVRFDPSLINVTSDKDVYLSDILVEVGSNVPPGIYNITVVARSETIRKTANLKVDVDPKVGSTWTRQNSGTREPLFGVTYGNGIFVTVGDGGTILTSPNGVNWTGQRSGTYNTLFGVTYGNGIFVVVGGGGIILISSDGVSWREVNSATENGLFKVTYGNGKFVAVGSRGTILTSRDAVNWSSQNSPTTNILFGVTYGNGIFVAVGSRGTLLTSRDAVNWTSQNSPTTESFFGVAYGNGIFVAVGSRGTLLTSRDAVNWTRQNSGTRAHLDSVTYGENGVWVVVGDQDDFSAVILTSLDTITWKRRETGTRNRLRDVTYGNGIFVVVGGGGTIFTSP